MTILINNPLSETEFNRRLKNLLVQLEDSRPNVYADTHNPSHPTIGIGFDLIDPSVRLKVYAAMGITVGSQIEQAVTAAIINAQGKSTAAIQQNLEAAYGAPFVMTEPQITSAFNEISKRYIAIAKRSGIAYSNELVALTSLAFNGLYGRGTASALNIADPDEARAEAWYQIRYVHVAGQNDKRRYAGECLNFCV